MGVYQGYDNHLKIRNEIEAKVTISRVPAAALVAGSNQDFKNRVLHQVWS
jgi:hypothetical protein